MSARLSVNVNDDTAAALRDLSAAKGITITEVVRQAVSVFHLIEAETRQGKSMRLVEREAS